MTQTGWKWFCKKCGYEHYGEEPPDKCLECEADSENFHKVEE